MAKVYFVDVKTGQESLLAGVDRLYAACGMDALVGEGDLVALKLHFGEPGNTGFVRAQYVRRLVDLVARRGAKPFLTDANTLYVGRRANAVDHIQSAVLNGFDFAVAGAPVVIADGLTGHDYVSVPIGGKHFHEVKIGSAVVHADALIAVTHFKGHEATGFGGVLKNLGMGCGSRGGKQMMHSDVLPVVNGDRCTGWGKCNRWCPTGAARVVEKEPRRPGQVHRLRRMRGHLRRAGDSHQLEDYAGQHPGKDRRTRHGGPGQQSRKGRLRVVVTDVTPDCDCCFWSDAPVVRNIGILASLDPVALDQAAVDLVNGEAGLAGSSLAGLGPGTDKFRALFPEVDWERQLTYAQSMGLGSREYELVRI